jgi:hypothetical protein
MSEESKIIYSPKYKRENYILKPLLDHIEENFKEGKQKKSKKYYCSMIAVLQSSRYGKTRLMERLGSKTPTFYSSLQLGDGSS